MILVPSPICPSDPSDVDASLIRQEAAREGLPNDGAPTLQSPLYDNVLSPSSGAIQHRYSLPFSEAVVNAARKAWRIVLQLALIMAVCLAGQRIADVLPLGIPGNICSMVLLLLFLVSGVIRMGSIKDAADFLLDNLLAGNILKLVAICLITTVLVFFVTSFTVSTVANLMARHEARATGGAAAEGRR